jgi:hypothetical protein
VRIWESSDLGDKTTWREGTWRKGTGVTFDFQTVKYFQKNKKNKHKK